MPDWQRRVIRRAYVLTKQGMSAVHAVATALTEEVKERPADLERMRSDMETWLRGNAIATADGTWSLEAAGQQTVGVRIT